MIGTRFSLLHPLKSQRIEEAESSSENYNEVGSKKGKIFVGIFISSLTFEEESRNLLSCGKIFFLFDLNRNLGYVQTKSQLFVTHSVMFGLS